jgi:hypothetical protein
MDGVPVNFFLKKKDIEENVVKNANSGTDTSTAYIIYQNNHLTTKINQVMMENVTLKQEKEEQEEFCDKLEKTRTCLQGYVKNEHERAIKYKELYQIYSKNFNEYSRTYLTFHITTIVSMMIMCILSLHSLMVFTTMVAFTAGNIYYALVIYYDTIRKQKNPKMMELIDELKKTEQSNMYIDDLIDNI